MRTAATIAGIALVLGGLAGCSGDDDGSGKSDGAAEHASKTEFCSAFQDLLEQSATTQGKDMSEQVKAVKEKVADLEDLGTPEGMPKDAQHGFEVFTDAVAKLDDDADQKDLQELGSSLSKEEQEDGTAFVTWAQQTCVPSAGEPSAPASSDG